MFAHIFEGLRLGVGIGAVAILIVVVLRAAGHMAPSRKRLTPEPPHTTD